MTMAFDPIYAKLIFIYVLKLKCFALFCSYFVKKSFL